jgi:hypothetical protein
LVNTALWSMSLYLKQQGKYWLMRGLHWSHTKAAVTGITRKCLVENVVWITDLVSESFVYTSCLTFCHRYQRSCNVYSYLWSRKWTLSWVRKWTAMLCFLFFLCFWHVLTIVKFIVAFIVLFIFLDRLCGLVVRVLGYRSGGPGSIPGTIRKKSSGSGTGCTQPCEYNWGATW